MMAAVGHDSGPTDEDRARAQEVHDELGRHMLLNRVGVLMESTDAIDFAAVSAVYNGLPTPGSPMAADMDELGSEVVVPVQKVCGAWHLVAATQLRAVESLHTDGHLLFADGPLLRSIMEHCARIGWVLDGGTATARAARAWLAQVVSNGEDTNTHRNLGSPVPTLAGAPARLADLCERTLPRLFDGAQPACPGWRTAGWSFLEQPWEHNTAVVERFFAQRVHPRWGPTTPGRVQYRVATMFAHPSTTAVFALADQSVDGAEFAWDWSNTRRQLVTALACFQIATRDLYDYFGWTPPELAAWSDHLGRFVTDTNPPAAEEPPA